MVGPLLTSGGKLIRTFDPHIEYADRQFHVVLSDPHGYLDPREPADYVVTQTRYAQMLVFGGSPDGTWVSEWSEPTFGVLLRCWRGGLHLQAGDPPGTMADLNQHGSADHKDWYPSWRLTTFYPLNDTYPISSSMVWPFQPVWDGDFDPTGTTFTLVYWGGYWTPTDITARVTLVPPPTP